MPELVIAHTGVKERSGRYKWGSGDRPYQRLEKRKSVFQKISEEREFKRKRKESAAKKAEAERLRLMEANKERVLKSGSATEVLKYAEAGMLTNKQLQTVANRIDTTQKIKSYAEKEVQTNMQKMDKIMKNVKTATEWTKIATESYNVLAQIYNSTPQGKKDPWILIEKGGKKEEKAKS